jgi:Dolichyl-phosphate-mannose-protein mannosyltransferase
MRLDSPDPASARNVEIGEVGLAHFHSLSWTEMAHTLPARRVALTPPAVLAPDVPLVPVGPSPGPGPASPVRRRRIRPAAGLLAGLLVVQALLSLGLVWSNTAYQDEALYLWAGRLEWQHWLHGTPLPDLQAYFSGAPVVYPPLGAAADAVWGLAGARILSLAFMLGASCLLWATTARLMGKRAAFFATAGWAVLGPVQRLGAFATYDAMAIFMLAVAAWSAVRAASGRTYVRWLLAAAAATVLANAAKYASAIFDPVIIGMAGLAACPRPGGKRAAARWTVVLTYLAATIIALLLIAGRSYELGIEATTLSRALGQQRPAAIAMLSWQWTGVVLATAACGVGLSLLGPDRKAGRTLLLCLLAAAVLLVPAEQARIHTATSLDKHVAFGAWFGAIAAGYAVDRIIRAMRWRLVRAELSLALGLAIVPVAAAGAAQARQFFGWPNATVFIRALRPLAERTTGPMLIETSSVAEYYLPGLRWQRWSNTFSITTRSGSSVGYSTRSITDPGQPATYRRYVGADYFALIALNYSSGRLDTEITKLLVHNPAYRATSVRYGSSRYVIWQRVRR